MQFHFRRQQWKVTEDGELTKLQINCRRVDKDTNQTITTTTTFPHKTPKVLMMLLINEH